MQIVKADASVTPTVVPWKDKTVRGKLWAILPWVVFGVACVLLVVGLIVHYSDGLDNDMASELVLSKLLSEGKGFIITDQWCYSTEIRFLNTQLIFAPLFWLFKSWMVVRIVGTIILHIIMLATFYFMLAALRQQKLFPWLATLLLLPSSYEWAVNFSFGTFYIPHIAIVFMLLGITFYALRTVRKQNFWLLTGLGGVLSLLSGIGGFRQVVILGFPLFLTAVIYWLLNRRIEQKSTALKLLFFGGIALVSVLAGLGINVLINQHIGFKDFQNIISWGYGFSWNNLVGAFNCVLTVCGFYSGNVFELWLTFRNLVAIILLIMLISSFVSLFRRGDRYQPAEKILGLFCLMGLVSIIIVVTFFVTDYKIYDVPRQYLPAMAVIVPWLAVYVQRRLPAWSITIKKITVPVKTLYLAVLWSVALASCLTCYTFYYYNDNNNGSNPHNDSLLAITAALLEGEYYQGYASLWQSNILTEFSDGAIDVWCWGNPQNLGFADNDNAGITWEELYGSYNHLDQIHPWLQRTDHFDRKPTGKVFLLFTRDENEKLVIPQKLAAAGGHVFYNDDYYIVYVYDSVDELRAIVDVQ